MECKADVYANWFLRFAMLGMLLSAWGGQGINVQKPVIFLVISLIPVLYCQYYHAKHFGSLITTGPYRYTRHPIYTSVFIANLALLWPITDKMLIGQTILVACMAGCWHFEEQAMLAKYGSIAKEYYARTPRLFFLYPIHTKLKNQNLPIE